MASVLRFLLISLIVLFGCHYREVGAGRHHKGKGSYGRGSYDLDRFRKLNFETIISGQSWCKLQETLGWRLYREHTLCDLGIIVRDYSKQEEDPLVKRVFEMEERTETTYSPYDNATQPTAFALTSQRFCAHRAVLSARSSVLNDLIRKRLGTTSSWAVRHIVIRVDNIPTDTFDHLLQFIYTYQIENFDTERHIIDLYVGAHMLKIQLLKDSIREYILNDMKNSIEQVHFIFKWLKWAQQNNDSSLETDLILMIRKVLRLESAERWAEFGKVICAITRDTYITSLNGLDRAGPMFPTTK